MPSKRTATKIDVPDTCFETKAVFPVEPSAQVIREIHEFIARTGKPYMWSRHTHTPPPDGSIPKYLDEFMLPKKHREMGYFSPCPCCTPEHPRFGRGMIAWFPAEHVVRLIGPRCFKTLNKEAHDEAVNELRQRKAREASITYLLRHRSRLLDAVLVFETATLVADAVQAFGHDLRHIIDKRINLPLYQTVRHGMKAYRERLELNADGSVRNVTVAETVGWVAGVGILLTPKKGHAFRLRQVVSHLRQALDREGWEDYITAIDDSDRHQLARVISSSLKSGKTLLEEIAELRRFADQLNINTMRRWGADVGNPNPLAIELIDQKLRIGRTPAAIFSVHIPDNLLLELRSIEAKPINESTDIGYL